MITNDRKENVTFLNDYEVNIAFENSPVCFPPHWHIFTEVVLATKDNCIYSINSKTYTLNKGDILFIWPTEMHEVVLTPEHASLILQFDSSIINRCRDINLNRYALQSHHILKVKEKPLLAAQIGEYLIASKDIYFSKDPFIETKIKIEVLQILTVLATESMNNMSNSMSSSDPLNEAYIKINNVCTYISENYDKDLTQEQMAEYAGFSRYHFARLFKEYTSTTFVHYLTKQRLQKAIELLGDYTVPITSIAYQTGFQSISNFNRVFKETKGCSPKEYRKLYYYNL